MSRGLNVFWHFHDDIRLLTTVGHNGNADVQESSKLEQCEHP